ncbi:MAG TPA: alpha-amylase family protein [Armatimonadota bacterium]|jgi:hypothetical protein
MSKWRVTIVIAIAFASLCAMAAAAPARRLGIKGFERATFWHVQAGISDADIERHVDALARSGVNGVIIGGGGHHYLHDDLPTIEEWIATARRVVSACHARGIRVCEHHSVVLTTHKDYALEHKDWVQRDFATGDFSVWPEYQTYAFCPNNPAFREHYWTVFADIVRRTGVDAAMSDDASFHHGCCCAACAARWKREAGGDIRAAYAASRTPGTPQWRRWNDVRQRWYGDFRRWLYARMRAEMPGIQCFSLLGSLLSPWGPQTSGANQEAMLDTGDAGWWEIYNPADFASWRRLSAEATALQEAGRCRKSDIAALPYADRAEQRDVVDPEEETFMWALSVAHGLSFTQARVFLNGVSPDEPTRPYWLFERDTLGPYLRGAAPAANVAIFFSRRSRDADPAWEANHTASAIGWAEALTDAGLPYRAAVEETLSAGRPKGVRTLIAPEVFALSSRHIATIEAWVRSGGALIATGRTGFCDENGEPQFAQRRARLERLFGVRFEGEPGSIPADGDPLHIAAGSGKRLDEPFEAYTQRLGKGTVVYIPSLPSKRFFQDQVNEGQPYVDARDAALAAALAGVVTRLTPDVPARGIHAPGAVMTTVWRQKGRLLVHLVNTGGAAMKPGEKVPSPSRVVWAASQPVRLRFAHAPRRVRVVSLDPSENRVIDNPGKEVAIASPRRYCLVVAEE